MATGGIRIDAKEFSRLYGELAESDKKLALRIRKNLRDQGKPLVKKMQAAVTDPTSKRSANIKQTKNRTRTVRGVDFDGSETRERITETRTVRTTTAALVAKGIGFRIGTGRTGGSAVFTSSGRNLPPERRPMFRALNKSKFRHPVFGNRDEWVEQAGRPYFGAVILEEREALKGAVLAAMDELAAEIAKRT